MYVPKPIQEVLTKTVALAKENDRDVPPRDRMTEIAAYSVTEDWLENLEGQPAEVLKFDKEVYVETHCTDPKPGDLFRPRTTAAEEAENTEWKLFLGGEMTPNDSWQFAMAYADPDTGMFEGIHFTHDSNTIELITPCRNCGEEQATETGELRIDGVIVPGPFCEDCNSGETSSSDSDE